MARSDLLLALVRAGAKSDQSSFRKALEALIVEERVKQHHVLADRLAAHLSQNNSHSALPSPVRHNGSRVDMLHEIFPRRTLDSLVLPQVTRNTCRDLIEEQMRVDLLRAHNLEPRHRILVVGPPGNGKTSLAEAVATELAVPLLVVRYETIIASYLGETALRMSQLFSQVRTNRCVLFFDEFDVIAKERGDAHETGEIKRVVSSLLLQIDDLPSHVIVMTATNHPELLDRAVWRRFQLRLELPAPTKKQIQTWFQEYEKSLHTQLDPNPSDLAKQFLGLSFSEIEQFCADVQRRYILLMPEGNIKDILARCLEQWQGRFSLKGKRK